MQPDYAQAAATGMSAAIQVMRTTMFFASVMSLLVGALPMLWGQVKVKWLVTAITSCVMFGIIGQMLRLFAGPMPASQPSHATEIDWERTGLLLLLLFGIGAAGLIAARSASALKRRRRKAAERAKERLLAADPASVAKTMAPDMLQQVEQALGRITLLKSLDDRISRPDDADALVMIDKRVPSVMDLYLKASKASTPEERQALARTALGSVIEIGQMAEDTRQRIAGDLRSELDTESRYISARSGYAGGLRAE